MLLFSFHQWWMVSGKNNCKGFCSTTKIFAKSTKQRLKFEHNDVPPYPYGPSQIYKQSNFGLYGTQKIRFGNMVSEKNEIKTRRHWRPNVHVKELYSEGFGKKISVRITTRVLRTLRKVGGLDEYLLGEKSARIKELGMTGWKLRWQLMQTPKIKERYRKQREVLGLPPLEEDLLPEQNHNAMLQEKQREQPQSNMEDVIDENEKPAAAETKQTEIESERPS
ncbi:54S ribosomal protein L24, mitochondrial [Erysiphe neolycopersici]|uniref:Large ribosomal subunit protein bL28m n=1 Tax=Erysiphe neolycopersici TaxID=212602 RepID=A0A420HW00_9PEZI|nr:54S ribosomal protein L24, mitochondrial [Erysiphe neolycopersici]